MYTKQLGDTKIKIPVIGLGTSLFIEDPSIITAGIELGATHIDTAESYGTEPAVGKAIKNIRDKVFLSTKISPKNFSEKNVFEAANNSLKNLNVNHIDLYQLHAYSDEIPIEETMQSMNDLVDQGKIRFIGVSNFNVQQLQRAQKASKHKIVSNQVIYNLSDREIEKELIPFCEKNKITIIAYTPIGKFGFSNEQNGERKRYEIGNQDINFKIRKILNSIGDEIGKTWAQVALNWCVINPQVVAIPKASSKERILENLESTNIQLSDSQINLLESVVLK